MATTFPTDWTGGTIALAAGTFIAKIISAEYSGYSRKVVETTPRTAFASLPIPRTFRPGKYNDTGQVAITMQFDGTKDPATPFAIVEETVFDGDVVITFPATVGTTWTIDGFITDYGWSGEDDSEDVMTATATLKLSGAIAVA